MPGIKFELERIARHHLGVDTLEERRSDALDFWEVSVWGLRDALLAAYLLGAEEAVEAEQGDEK